MTDRRIEYLTVDPKETSFVVTDEVLRFLELKYASLILGYVDPKESDSVRKVLSGVFTDVEKQELEDLSKAFAERGITYPWLASVMDKKYPVIISGIHKQLLEKRNSLLKEANLFESKINE